MGNYRDIDGSIVEKDNIFDGDIDIARIISIFPSSQKSYGPVPTPPWTVLLGYKCVVERFISDADHERLLQFAKYKFFPVAQLSFDNAVFIRAHINGKYFCADEAGRAEYRPIVANRDVASDWEHFMIVKNSDGSLSMKSNANGKFLSVRLDDGGRITAGADKVDSCEKFQIFVQRIGGQYALLSVANKKYVSVDPKTGSVRACADAPREWEWISISPCGVA